MKKELINEIEELNWEMDLNRRIQKLLKITDLKAEIKEYEEMLMGADYGSSEYDYYDSELQYMEYELERLENN